MFAWLDALTPKQAQLMVSAKVEMERRGWRVVITTRRHDYTLGIFRIKGVEPIVVGGYGGERLESKLEASLKRSLELMKIISGLPEKPKVHVSLSSPEAVRVAFGLKVPSILFNDTPHSVFVNRLTLPLAVKVIVPEAIPKRVYSYAVPTNRIVHYRGVDEVAWMRGFKPDPSVLEELELSVDDVIVVVRSEEAKASYYPKLGFAPTLRLIEKLYQLEGVKIVYFGRYSDQKRAALKMFPNLIVPEEAVDGPSLIAYSSLVITGGGTMAREGALLGVPSICVFPAKLHVNEWLEKRGFPLWWFRDVDEAAEHALKVLREPDRFRVDTSRMLMELESPVEALMRVLEEVDIDG
ncbi:MAG: hypothetical protein DRJ20_02225 [Candidatus Methanomethylicota archaeon]|uniref:DUF354 domain-containing protein n=1 Tax=Thermoproteota archaeon TaxID=2056631 RepID=A0A497EW97_9CREN|nr:MAG: hypothetical protein DRJ20_02225 [Candidatus Verstraetearchaeota archaeon]